MALERLLVAKNSGLTGALGATGFASAGRASNPFKDVCWNDVDETPTQEASCELAERGAACA